MRNRLHKMMALMISWSMIFMLAVPAYADEYEALENGHAEHAEHAEYAEDIEIPAPATPADAEPLPATPSDAIVPENDSQIMVAALDVEDYTEPKIHVIRAESDRHSGVYYWPAPTIRVTDAGGNLKSIELSWISEPDKSETLNVSSGSEEIKDLSGTEGYIKITAKDDQEPPNTATTSIYIGHSFGTRTSTTLPPTCTLPERRITRWICGYCYEMFDGWTSNVEGGEPELGHAFSSTQEATLCGKDGEVEIKICTQCGEVKYPEGIDPDASQHQWKTEKTVKPATCTDPGMSYTECAICGARKDITVIPATGHNFYMAEWKNTEGTPSGDTHAGVIQEQECRNGCGTKNYRTLGDQHVWSAKVVLKEPTCETAGRYGYRCTVCRATSDAESIPALGHIYEDDHDCTTLAVCTRCEKTIEGEAGHRLVMQHDQEGHWKVCANSGCSYTTADQKEPHKESASAGDCTKGYICTECSYKVDAQYAAHKLVIQSNEYYHWWTCERDGCLYETAKTEHVSQKKVKDCTVEDKCTECGYVIAEAKEHDFTGPWMETISHHYRVCRNEGCDQRSDWGEHSLTKETGDCTKALVCAVCDYISAFGKWRHSFENSPYYYSSEAGHYQKCMNSEDCKATSAVTPHRGGTATCTQRAQCEDCHEFYGEKNKDNHVGSRTLMNAKNPTWTEPGYSGDFVCGECGEIVEKGHDIPAESVTHNNENKHTFVKKFDKEKSWEECTLCEYKQNVVYHSLSDWQSSEEGHWQYCTTCEYRTEPVPHVPGESDKDCTTPITCTVCHYDVVKAEAGHHFIGAYHSDGNGHWQVCANADCGVTSDPVPHSTIGRGDCTVNEVCEICDFVVTPAASGHIWSSEWETDDRLHTKKCLNPNCTVKKEETHNFVDDDLCTTPVLCSVCGRIQTEGKAEHNFGGEYLVSPTGHWLRCQNENCNAVQQESPHVGGTANCHAAAICEVCGWQYGGLDPTRHEGGEEIKGYRPPTQEEPGYTGDTWCLGCGSIVRGGDLLEQLPQEYEHSFVIPGSDDLHHWMQCSCGTRDEESYKEHTFGGYEADGIHHRRTCSECGRTVSDEHIYIIKRNEDGHWQECKVCGYRSDEKPHVWDRQIDNCEDADTEIICTVCGEDRNPTTHSWDGGTVTKEAFCTDTGIKTYHCTVCRSVKEEAIPAEGHSFRDGVCALCGKVISPDDKDGLIQQKKDLQQKLADTSLSAQEQSRLKAKLDLAETALESIDRAEKMGLQIGGLPSVSKAGEADFPAIREAAAAYDSLTEAEKNMVPQEYRVKLEQLRSFMAEQQAVHVHQYGTDWKSDGSSHWHECECGMRSDVSSHLFENGMCTVCGVKNPDAKPEKEPEKEPEKKPEKEDTDNSEEDRRSAKVPVPAAAMAGYWMMDEKGWRIRRMDGSFAVSSWGLCFWNGGYEWYHFDADGYIQSGWFADADGHKYYLNPQHDGNFGRMFTGWVWIDGKCYYFNPETNGTVPQGAMLCGVVTPDGYTVNELGQWVVDGVVQTR